MEIRIELETDFARRTSAANKRKLAISGVQIAIWSEPQTESIIAFSHNDTR